MSEPLEFVYREHRQGLFSLAVSITGSYQVAEDAIQNAFAKLFQFPIPQGDLVAYVYKSVRNAAIDAKRKDVRNHQLRDALINGYQTLNTTEPADVLMTKERHEILRQAIEQLEAADQEAIVLKSFAGLTFEQAGVITDTSPKTIASRYRRALQKLEQRLGSHIY